MPLTDGKSRSVANRELPLSVRQPASGPQAQGLAHRASSSAKVGSAVATEPESRLGVAAQARSVLFTELQPDSERSRVAARSFLFAEFQLTESLSYIYSAERQAP